MSASTVELNSIGSEYQMGTLPDQVDATPLVITAGANSSVEGLLQWLNESRAELSGLLLTHGAFLFRGFNVSKAEHFERVALTLNPQLQTKYLGTSPREAITRHVFSASELPGYYPVPQHCEMSFLKTPPSNLYFCCLKATSKGGETPLVDFRLVHDQMNPAIRDRFIKEGIRIYRNYNGPADKRNLDMWKLKRWDEMFGTEDKSSVEQQCQAANLDYEWTGNDRLRLIDHQPAVRHHPKNQRPAWFSHLQVFHPSTAAAEYRRIHNLRGGLDMWALWRFSQLSVALRRQFVKAHELPFHVTYGNGTEIPEEHVEHVRDLIWKNMVIYPWQEGDIVAIDNYSVSHGRLPYKGKSRTVVVSWA